MRTNKRTAFKDLPAPKQAGILCTDERFQRFAAEQIGFGNAQLCETATTEYLRTFCKVYSREARMGTYKGNIMTQHIDSETIDRVGRAALEHMFDRKGLRHALESIREDAEIWREIVEETGRAALSAMPAQEVSAQDVLRERARQVQAEGFSPKRDDRYTAGQLAYAAASYAAHAGSGTQTNAPPRIYQKCPAEVVSWPWAKEWWKPITPRRDLVKAAALIIAEIDRLDRTLPEKSE